MDNIQLASNETLIQIMQHQREQNKMIRNMFVSLLISIVLIVGMCVGGAMYFLNTFEVEASTETTQTVEGDSAQINNVEGDQYKDNSQNNKNE